MKFTVFSWKDERWSADKETLKAINKQIQRSYEMRKTRKLDKVIDMIGLVIGWIILSPFILGEWLTKFLSWAKSKIKRKSWK